MKKTYFAQVVVNVSFEADEDNLPVSDLDPDRRATLEELAVDVVYGRDKKDNDRTDNNGTIEDFVEERVFEQ